MSLRYPRTHHSAWSKAKGRSVRLATLARAVLASAEARKLGGPMHELRRRLYSDWLHYGLRRDLTEPFEAPSAKIPLTIRPLRESDLPVLLGMDMEHMSERGPYVRMHRLNFSHERIGQCYVAATVDDEPCYMQWLMSGLENQQIERYFHGIFPTLAADEALLEYAFTPERYQGKGIMPAAMARIAEKAADLGARRVITFVDHENVPALKGCQRSGFRPYLLRRDRWRFLRRRVSFQPLPAGARYPFETEASGDEADRRAS
jgi:RimJ/RimL family protein N-acetyltransferase